MEWKTEEGTELPDRKVQLPSWKRSFPDNHQSLVEPDISVIRDRMFLILDTPTSLITM